MNISKNPLEELTFCVFDLETTGPNQKEDKIIEIGLIKISKLSIIEKREYLVNPQRKIPDFIQKLTKINNKTVKNCPTIEEIIDEILDFMNDSILVAHNISFDIPFFNAVLRRLKRPILKNKAICTNLMTKNLMPSLVNSNLNYMCKIFQIEHGNAHRALDDAFATAKLLLKFLQIFSLKNIKKINHLYYPRSKFELDRKNFKHKTSLIKTIKKLSYPFLVTAKGKKGVIVYSLPLHSKRNIDELNKNLLEHQDIVYTLKIFGNFLDALVNFHQLSKKIPPLILEQIIALLYKIYIPEKNILSSKKKLGDFIIFNHLIPGQFVATPLIRPFPNHQLIFTYPAQKKKLYNFICSKKYHLKKKCDHEKLDHGVKQFFMDYLDFSKIKKDSILFIDRLNAQNNSEVFFYTLENFIKGSNNPASFPEIHL